MFIEAQSNFSVPSGCREVFALQNGSLNIQVQPLVAKVNREVGGRGRGNLLSLGAEKEE